MQWLGVTQLVYNKVKFSFIYHLLKINFCIFSDLNSPEHTSLKELEITDIASQTDLSCFNQTDSSNQTDPDHLNNQTSGNQKHEGVQCDNTYQENNDKYCQTDTLILIDKSITTDLLQKEIISDTNCKSTEFKAKSLIDDVIGDIIVDVVNRNEASSDFEKRYKDRKSFDNTLPDTNADGIPSKERSLGY